jgi:hypothetical protein
VEKKQGGSPGEVSCVGALNVIFFLFYLDLELGLSERSACN